MELSLVRAIQIRRAQPARPPGALGNIVAGELDVDSPQAATAGCVDVECLIELTEDVLEVPRLESVPGYLGVAVHAVAAPQDGLAAGLRGFDEPGQIAFDTAAAEAVYE